MQKRNSRILNFIDWVTKIDEVLFYYDLRATLDGIECGVGKKIEVTRLCRRNNAKFNWVDYSLELFDK